MIRNLDFNIATIMLMLLVIPYFLTQYDTSTKSGKGFLRLIICILISNTLNIVCDLLALKISGNMFLYILSSIYLFFVASCAFILTDYTRILIHSDTKRATIDVINYILHLLFGISCIPAVYFHFYMSFNDGVVAREKGYIVVYILSAYYLLCAFFRMSKNLTMLSKKQAKSVFYFVIVTFTGACLQLFVFKEQMIIFFIYSLSTLILLFAFETPDYQKMIKATSDLQESKAKEEDLSKTIHQLMKTSSWLIYFDKDGNITEAAWSDEIRSLLGYSKDDDIDISSLWVESLHPDEKEEVLAAFMDGIKGNDYRVEARLRNKDGSYHWFLCTGSIHKDENGNAINYQGIIQNIDDEIYKRELINERLNAMTELEKSQAELQEALFAAQEANSAKTTFLSSISHDIRTPMNAILGFTQLAQERIDDKKEVADCLSTIRTSGDHLLSLINDVLDMSHIESGKVKLQPEACDLEELIYELGFMTKANVDAREQTYETVIETLTNKYVMVDRLRLNQVLINCVGNSIKYTPEGGHIKVVLSEQNSTDDGKANFVFKIIDNGIGMSKEFLERVFEPFERVQDSTTSKIQGTGLGMAITSNIVRIMGGTIAAESELGNGSTFIITLPLALITKEEYESAKAPEATSASMDEMLNALSGKKFLVVDDNKINRTVVKRLLGDRGMIIDECESGPEAIEIAKSLVKDSYDMIFMDIQMPGMSGFEAASTIRSLNNEIAKTIPIIAMTANAFEEDKKEAAANGMNGHVTKPFIIEDLVKFLYERLIIS